MEMSLQIETDFAHIAGATSVAAREGAPEPARAPMALRAAVCLLTKASRAVWGNQDEAHQCIVKAAALLQAESEARDRDAENGTNRGRLAPWQVKRVDRFIDERLGDRVEVQEIAAVARLGRGHFARAFRATVGEAPHAYLIRRRVERAQQLILLTDRPLAQIALDCGLTDQPHMTRLFRRVVGMSPGAWRRRHRSGARDLAASMKSNLAPDQHFGIMSTTDHALAPARRDTGAEVASRLRHF